MSAGQELDVFDLLESLVAPDLASVGSQAAKRLASGPIPGADVQPTWGTQPYPESDVVKTERVNIVQTTGGLITVEGMWSDDVGTLIWIDGRDYTPIEAEAIASAILRTLAEVQS